MKRKMSAWLPPVPCFPEMRASVLEVAKRDGRSISDIQREALSLFLSATDSNASKSALNTTEDQKGGDQPA